MFRERTRSVSVVVCLGWAVVALQSFCVASETCVKVGVAAPSDDSSLPAQNSAFEAPTDNARAPALSSAGPEEHRITPRPLCKRLVLPTSSTGPEAPGGRFPRRPPVSNWVSSYLPKSDFCTVLSRFRI